MQVPNARIPHAGLEEKSRKRRPFRRRLGVREFLRMPCLLPATAVVTLGLLAVAAGAGMSVVGYVPGHGSQNTTTSIKTNNTVITPDLGHGAEQFTLKACAYVGPVLMAIGIFAMITACVFYCEVLDKYAILVPDKKKAVFTREELYDFIIGEMKKSYAQTLITAYSKAAEQSRLLDSQSCGREITPEYIPYKTTEPLTLEQQIDIECEGYTPSPPIPNKRYSIIQARIQRLKSEDNWLKTSSLPNIRRSASIKRAGRAPIKTDSKTLSCDYTMDEARLRRKSMMLRTIVQWNSGSSDMFVQKQRRFSSVKALPSYHRDSYEDISQKGYGSFPLTRLIERRGTFACGDMRTRRMKFLLLLEASESQEGFNDSVCADGRHTVAAIRRNSFIPYTTCDKFIAGEERKTIRDRRRSSVNPFTTRHRVNPVAPQPTTRRHSFYPIRRDTKIYNIDPNEHRRHSFNPMGLSTTLRPEFAGNMEGRRASFNPGSLLEEIRPANIPQQASGFLQVPGLDTFIEGRPSLATNDVPDRPQHSGSDGAVSCLTTESYEFPLKGFQDERRIDRRHSFNPVARAPGAREGNQLRVPKITINEDSPERRLLSPSQGFCIDERERRHSFTPPSRSGHSSTTSSKIHDKPTAPRISFNLEPSVPSAHLLPQSAQTVTKSTLKSSKASPEPVRPSSFKQEMVVFRPLKQHDSRSASPSSNIYCSSENTGSDHSMALPRTLSVASDKPGHSAFTLSPAPAGAINILLPQGDVEQSPSFSLHVNDSPRMTDSRPAIPQTQQLSPNTLTIDTLSACSGSTSDRKVERKAASFCYTGGLGRAFYQHLDTPGSTSSGPAALSISTIHGASATIHRSKSASALPGGEFTRPLSPHTAFSYARVPKPASPLVTRHKTKARQHSDKRTS